MITLESLGRPVTEKKVDFQLKDLPTFSNTDDEEIRRAVALFDVFIKIDREQSAEHNLITRSQYRQTPEGGRCNG